MPTCYMLVGLPGSGKTTKARELLSNNPNLEVLSSDAFIDEFSSYQEEKIKKNPAYIAHAKKIMRDKLDRIFLKKKSFVWDQTNTSFSSRQKKIHLLKKNSYEVIGIFWDLSLNEIKARVLHRSEKGGKVVSLDLIEEMSLKLDPPTLNEGFARLFSVDDHNNIRDASNQKVNLPSIC